MKLIKLTNDHYIIVDDSEIKEGDWYYWEITKTIQIAKLDSLNRLPKNSDGSKKITHSTQPLEDYTRGDGKTIKVYVEIEQLHLYKIKELIGEVDVEESAQEYAIKSHSPNREARRKGYIDGYNQALEDNKEKKYTEEDIRKTVWEAIKIALNEDFSEKKYNEIIKSLQPKTEWEVEFEDNKLKLK